MLPFAVLLMTVGIILLCIEVAMPGFGVLGISGFAFVLISAVVTILNVPFGLFIVAGELALLFVVALILFKYIRKNQFYGKIILDENLNDEQKPIGDYNAFLGKTGAAKTSLRPHGTVDFNGLSIDVFSDGSYIPEGARVKVVDVSQNGRVIVTRLLEQ